VSDKLPMDMVPFIIFFGIVIGVIGDIFKRALYYFSDLYQKLRIPEIVRPIIPLLMTIPMGFLAFEILGGGHPLIENLASHHREIHVLLILLAVKLVFTAICFGSGAAGGIFLPFLTMGALAGCTFFEIVYTFDMLPDAHLYLNFIILGMTGMFAAVVRAPITGIILLIEMCGNFTQFPALVIVSFSSYLCVELLNSAPVYNVLLDRILKSSRKG
jgi:H+/Cl- antiporter ClcA